MSEENKKIGESTLVDVFTKIYGVGPKNAEKIIKAGIKSISELREKEEDFLNTNQKLGLKYYEDINQRIPRSEIDEYSSLFQKYFNEAKSATSQSDAVFEIVGSYRREAKDSGDIDIIISNKNNNKTVFNKFIDLLVDNNIILHKLTDGTKQIKILVIGKLGNKPARRIDFMYTTYEEYPFAILYFTGSQAFNTAMRQHALEQGYTMNEHRLENTTTRKSVTNIQSEKDIFKFLNLEYVEPKERIDLSSLKIIDTKPSPEKSDKPKSKVKLNIRDKFIDEFNKNSTKIGAYSPESVHGVKASYARDSKAYRRSDSAGGNRSRSTTKELALPPDDSLMCPPSFLSGLNPNMEIIDGTRLELKVSVKGDPLPQVTWTKDGKDLASNDIIEVKYKNGVALLTVNEIYPEDSGKYTCKASNAKGSVETSSNIKVLPKAPKGELVPRDVTVLVSPLVLTFRVS